MEHVSVEESWHDTERAHRARQDRKVKMRSLKSNHLSSQWSDSSDDNGELANEDSHQKSARISADLRKRFQEMSSVGEDNSWTADENEEEKKMKKPPSVQDHNLGEVSDFTCQDGDSVTLEVALAQNLIKFGVMSSELISTWEKELNVDGTQTATVIPVSRRKLAVKTTCTNLEHVTSFFSSRTSVYAIQIRTDMHVLNKHATKVMQGSGAGLQTVLWDQGLTGEGQIVGIADTGIDIGEIFV